MPSTSVSVQHKVRTPLWAIAVAALIALKGHRPATSREKRPYINNRTSGTARENFHGKTGTDDRGRDATHPGGIPPKGWKDVVVRIYQGISEDRIVAISAGVTFLVLLALFP